MSSEWSTTTRTSVLQTVSCSASALDKSSPNMTVRLPPKSRHTPLMSFYALGETHSHPQPSRFLRHNAEPGPAATLSKRNPHNSQSVQPSVPGSPGNQGHLDLNSVQALRVAQARAYVDSPSKPKTNVTYSEFLRLRDQPEVSSSSGPQVIPRAFKLTQKQRKKAPIHSPTQTSDSAPEWFSISSSCDVTKSPGYDGTITMLSRINGWITVTPKAKDRSKRMGRNGPFALNTTRKYDLHRVSDLTPAWMQTQAQGPATDPFKKAGGFSTLREGASRLFLVDVSPPTKSQFSLGDFRHNVRTKEEALHYMSTASPVPKELLVWKT